MELNKTHNWFYILTSFSVFFILALGSWWLYLFFKLANKLQEYELSAVEGNLITMLQWEGLTFFILLLGLAFALFYVFFQDHRKTKSLQAFFSSLTHELKTPLASIRLQSQVLNDLVENSKIDDSEKKQLQKYANRLQDDTVRLENELDKHLQLSRIERNGPLNLTSIELLPYLQNETKKYSELTFNIHNTASDSTINVDEFALSMILRNLIENTLRHTDSRFIDIQIHEDKDFINLVYKDNGPKFKGEASELGKLFYKFNSPKGSGLGLYLISRLIQKINGKFKIHNQDSLSFSLIFKRGENE